MHFASRSPQSLNFAFAAQIKNERKNNEMTQNAIEYHDLGLIDYGKAWDLQETLLKEALAIKAKNHRQTEEQEITRDRLLLCEHPHVYTLGKSGMMENLLVGDRRLAELGVQFFRTNRGGDITYHGPGQVVGYPVLDLEHYFTDLGRYMRSLEQVIIDTLADYGIEAARLEGATGVWLDPEDPQRARKICAMGVKCSRWVTIHGFAFNVNVDLQYFDWIVPCGIRDKKVTSLDRELGYRPDIEEVKQRLKKHFGKVFLSNFKDGGSLPSS